MGHKKTKSVILIEALTGITLITYVCYHVRTCGTTSMRLDVIPFMAHCVSIVIVGFAIATLCECWANKTRIESLPKVVLRRVIEVLVIIAVIVIICLVVATMG